MPTLTINDANVVDGQVLDKVDISDITDSLETFINVTKLDGDNLQTGGVPTAALANAAVTADKLAAAVAGSGLAGGAGSALSVNVDDSTIEISSDSLRVKDAGITTAKLLDANVTRAKLEALGHQLSSSSGAFSHNSAVLTDVTNLSVSITTTGRPIRFVLVSDNNGTNPSNIGATSSGTVGQCYFKAFRGATEIGYMLFGPNISTDPGTFSTFFPPGAAEFFDTPAAGTYTYKLQAASDGATSTVFVEYCKLLVYEL